MNPTIEALAKRLRVERERLSMLESCNKADLTRFETAVARAIDTEDAAVERGVADSLRFLPGPVRLAAKKMVFGGKR